MYEQFSEVDVPPSDIVKTQQTPNLKILKGELQNGAKINFISRNYQEFDVCKM